MDWKLSVFRHLPLRVLCLAALLSLWPNAADEPAAAADADDGFVPIFDGESLKDWDGNPKFWRVEDGAITGETTAENPTDGNTFIIWRGGETRDFELKLEYRIVGGNSGIQYRSFEVPDRKWVIGGYQGDFEAGDTYSGILYGERFRGILGLRGQRTQVQYDHKPELVETFADGAKLQSVIRNEDWNDYHIIARGYRFQHKINGQLMVDVTDEDREMRRSCGLLALQLHAGPPMKVQFRNIRLKSDSPGEQIERPCDARKVVFVAGEKSHGYGAHEHRAGCLLLAEALRENVPHIETKVYAGGWPDDPAAFDGADAVVVYCDGGGRHPFNSRLDEIGALMDNRVGLVCIHYAVEVPKGEPGNRVLDWTGGYFETHWSVNPHWTADYAKLPTHDIARGVRPFRINDEWYYHMRFPAEASRLTPILTDIPPSSTLDRPDGPHSGNEFVRAELGKPQHMAWAFVRPNGGRGFGFTGGHIHWNWGHDDFRKLVLNAIVWSAHGQVPESGVASKTPTFEDLQANQDYEPPDDFNPARIQKLLSDFRDSPPAR